ncbi:MAG: hypothetical protein IPF99_09940 [Deltaproteobacteria bacterium]|jgi:hypothetical protein|nr:hypothetical protein [Deltaproteobacteria bacterium]
MTTVKATRATPLIILTVAGAMGCAPSEPPGMLASQTASVMAAQRDVPVTYFSNCLEAPPSDEASLASYAARPGNVVISASAGEVTDEVRHVRLVNGDESLEFDCRVVRLSDVGLVAGRSDVLPNHACVPDISTYRKTAADGRVSVPYPGTEDGWNQRDVVRSRRGSPIAFWGKDEGGVFVSSLVLPLEAGEVVTSRARVRIDGLGRIVTALRAAVR